MWEASQNVMKGCGKHRRLWDVGSTVERRLLVILLVILQVGGVSSGLLLVLLVLLVLLALLALLAQCMVQCHRTIC